MTKETVKKLIKAYSLVAEMEALKTNVIAMQTKNALMIDLRLGQAWPEASFDDVTSDLEEIAQELRKLSEE